MPESTISSNVLGGAYAEASSSTKPRRPEQAPGSATRLHCLNGPCHAVTHQNVGNGQDPQGDQTVRVIRGQPGNLEGSESGRDHAPPEIDGDDGFVRYPDPPRV